MYSLANPYEAETGDNEITLVIDIVLKPGTEKSFEEAVKNAIKINRSEIGCIEFTCLKVRGEDGKYILIERWESQNILDLHMKQSATQHFFNLLEQYLAYSLSEIYEHISFTKELSPS